MSGAAFTVFIVDDDVGVLNALSRLVRSAGYDVRGFNSAQAFLDEHDAKVPGCAILDVAMPGYDGLQLQKAIVQGSLDRPVIFVTGSSDIPTSVQAMKAGAVDFLTKPVNAGVLLALLDTLKEREAQNQVARAELSKIRARLATLTAREREVLTHVVAGRLNKQIAGDLGTVEKTIKVHRGRMMEKMCVRSVADLVRVADRAGISPFSHKP
jgi:FixJ family two-component response regulator